MSTTRDLIDALISGDSTSIENTFDSVMSQKVSAELDTLKTHIATNMFLSPSDAEDTFEAELTDQTEEE